MSVKKAMDSILNDTRKRLQEAFELVRGDFATVRTGKASSSLVENIVIPVYGGSTRLKVMEVATIHVADPQTLVITPFDQSVISEIERGIADAKVGLNPIIDGQIIRISLPPLTEERRREFVKMIHQKAEQGRIMVRHVRHEAMETLKKKGEGAGVSEDEVTRLEREIQKLTDEFIEKIDILRDEKEEELMKI